MQTGSAAATQAPKGQIVTIDCDKPLAAILKDAEALYIIQALEKSQGNMTKAAKLAGLSYATFRTKARALPIKKTYTLGA